MILAHFLSMRYSRMRALKFANFPAIENITGKSILSRNYVLLVIRLSVLVMLVLSISGTVVWYEGREADFDYMLAIDSSGSMLAQDYKPDRLSAAKNASLIFVESLPTKSRVGVLSFSGITFIRQRPTYDQKDIRDKIQNISAEIVGGTAIGSAIITSVNLMEGEKPGVLILLTDGQNNVGPPVEEGIRYAKEAFVTIYTIGVATPEGGTFENLTFISKLDSDTLEKIAEQTGGKYFQAENETQLQDIFMRIATSEEKNISVNISLFLLLIGIILLFVEWILVNTRYRTIP